MAYSADDITVVIPNYNYGQYLKVCIESIRAQSAKIKHIIISDDGSDELFTISLLNEIEKENPLIQIIRAENAGSAIARNRGIKLVETPLFLMIDSDDTISPTFVEKALAIINKDEKVGAVSCWAQEFGLRHNLRKFKESTLLEFLNSNRAVNCGLIRTSIWQTIGGYDEQMTYGHEDWEFWISLVKTGYKLAIIPEALFQYRIKSKSRNVDACQKFDIIYKYILNKHRDVFLSNYPDSVIDFKRQINAKNHALLASPTYKLGQVLLAPIKYLRSVVR